MSFTLPILPYDYNALDPHIDAQTMEIHHTKHHQAYVDKLNAAFQTEPDTTASLEDIMKQVSSYSAAVRNNGGGHWNHSFFWNILSTGSHSLLEGTLYDAIKTTFGGVDALKAKFNQAAMARFGSGWAWLIVGGDKKLSITTTPNQDNPLMDVVDQKGAPIVGVDVWEHAYYLRYQNRRADYLAAFWNVVNWDEVQSLYQTAV